MSRLVDHLIDLCDANSQKRMPIEELELCEFESGDMLFHLGK
jgi:hypothetical protein